MITQYLAGKANNSHNHDDKYAQIIHDHDDRYYTETEIDTLLKNIKDDVETLKESVENNVSSHVHTSSCFTRTCLGHEEDEKQWFCTVCGQNVANAIYPCQNKSCSNFGYTNKNGYKLTGKKVTVYCSDTKVWSSCDNYKEELICGQ